MKIEKRYKNRRDCRKKAPEKVEILLDAGMHCLGYSITSRNLGRSLFSAWNRS